MTELSIAKFEDISVAFHSAEDGTILVEARPFLVEVMGLNASYVPKFVENNVWSENRSLQTMGLKGRSRWFVNEAGLYQLIFASNSDAARKVQRWVFEDVLPNIRKNGYYLDPNATKTQLESLQRDILHHANWTVDEFLEALGEDQADRRLDWDDF